MYLFYDLYKAICYLQWYKYIKLIIFYLFSFFFEKIRVFTEYKTFIEFNTCKL